MANGLHATQCQVACRKHRTGWQQAFKLLAHAKDKKAAAKVSWHESTQLIATLHLMEQEHRLTIDRQA
jgi:hypothetical protein